jgi:hypothetical protein
MRKKNEKSFEDILGMMKAQFGHVAKAFWVYDGDLCPCCSKGGIDEMMYKGKKAMSLNFFMYRERGVLIAYALCGTCATEILAKAKNTPKSMHQAIEKNLTGAYLRYVNSLDA